MTKYIIREEKDVGDKYTYWLAYRDSVLTRLGWFTAFDYVQGTISYDGPDEVERRLRDKKYSKTVKEIEI